jgi:hypothetical protein
MTATKTVRKVSILGLYNDPHDGLLLPLSVITKTTEKTIEMNMWGLPEGYPREGEQLEDFVLRKLGYLNLKMNGLFPSSVIQKYLDKELCITNPPIVVCGELTSVSSIINQHYEGSTKIFTRLHGARKIISFAEKNARFDRYDIKDLHRKILVHALRPIVD